jgi:outer membrane protein
VSNVTILIHELNLHTMDFFRLKWIALFSTVILTLGCFSYLNAQQTISSLEEAVRIIESHPELLIADILSREAQKDYSIQAGSFLPKLRATGMADYYPDLPVQIIPAEIFGGTPGSFREVRFGQPWVLSTGIELNWPVWQPDYNANLRAASIQREIASEEIALKREELKRSLIQMYYQILFWEAYLPFLAEQDNQATLLYATVMKRHQEETAGKMELQRAEALSAQIKLQLKEADYQLERALVTLGELLQYPLGEKPRITDKLSTSMEPSGPQPKNILEDPLIRSSRLRTGLIGQQLRAQQMKFYPSLSVIGRYQFQWQSADLFRSEDYIGFRIGQVGLSASVPIYQGGQTRNAAEKLQLQLNRQNIRTEKQIRDISLRNRQWLLEHHLAAEQFPLAEKQFELTRNNLSLALMRLDEGYSQLEEYFSVYQEHIQAAQTYYQTLLNYKVTYAYLQY